MMRIISGGQTGADRTALEVAKECGFETGGVAPKGYITETGPDLSLKDFGLTEHALASYPERTRENVRISDLTVWFGTVGTPGYKCTVTAAKRFGKPFVANPSATELVARIRSNNYQVVNIAGNRLSKNPGVRDRVRAVLYEAFEELE